MKITWTMPHFAAALALAIGVAGGPLPSLGGTMAEIRAPHGIETGTLAQPTDVTGSADSGVGPALELGARRPLGISPPSSDFIEANASVRPHWCNSTIALIDDIHRRGGYSVMRAEIGEGRVLERYWNDQNEEVVIEHGSDGTSCLVDLRSRTQP